jgi:uncharacterized membrane protein
VLRREFCGSRERILARAAFSGGVLGLLLLLSAEAYSYCAETIDPPERARWVGLMSISVVWGVYATALLAVGFWRRFRALRVAGLALFGGTALKLVFVDIAGIKQVYRIAAFIVLGVLMVGAAYLYSRVGERILEPAGGGE